MTVSWTHAHSPDHKTAGGRGTVPVWRDAWLKFWGASHQTRVYMGSLWKTFKHSVLLTWCRTGGASAVDKGKTWGEREGNLTPSMSFLNQWSKTDGKTQHKTAVRMLKTEHSITVSGTVWSSQCLKVIPGTRLQGFSSFTTITHVRLITKFCPVLVGKLAALQV